MQYKNRVGSDTKICTKCGAVLVGGAGGNWRLSDQKRGRNCCRQCRDKGKNPKGLRRALFRARQRARKRGLSATLRLPDLLPLPTHCPLLGLPLVYNVGRGSVPNRATLDRIDSRKGYEPGNVWIVSMRANTLKSDATLDEMKMLVKAWEMFS